MRCSFLLYLQAADVQRWKRPFKAPKTGEMFASRRLLPSQSLARGLNQCCTQVDVVFWGAGVTVAKEAKSSFWVSERARRTCLCGWKGSEITRMLRVFQMFLKVGFQTWSSRSPGKKGRSLCWRAAGQITRAPADPLCSWRNFIMAIARYLLWSTSTVTTRGLAASRGYGVIEDLGIDFWFTSARPVCFWMRHAGVDLKKLLDLGFLATAGKMEQ